MLKQQRLFIALSISTFLIGVVLIILEKNVEAFLIPGAISLPIIKDPFRKAVTSNLIAAGGVAIGTSCVGGLYLLKLADAKCRLDVRQVDEKARVAAAQREVLRKWGMFTGTTIFFSTLTVTTFFLYTFIEVYTSTEKSPTAEYYFCEMEPYQPVACATARGGRATVTILMLDLTWYSYAACRERLYQAKAWEEAERMIGEVVEVRSVEE